MAAQPASLRDMQTPDPPPGLSAVYEGGELVQTPTRMNFVAASTVKGRVMRDSSGIDSLTSGMTWEEHTVWVANGRRRQLGLHLNGVELLDSPISSPIDFLSKDTVIDSYYPQCEALLKKCLGPAVAVKAFDHNVRKQVGGPQKPVGVVHGDYTTVSGPRRLELLAESPKINDVWRERLGESPLLNRATVDECMAGRRRWAFINVWRNIDAANPVKSTPLACIDAQSHVAADLRVLEIQYPDRTGENYLVCPSERHQWVYYPDMTCDEALLIKQWDSHSESEDVSKLSLHSAFRDPTTPTAAPPRQSIEVRCVVIWDERV